MYISRFICI